MNVVIYARYSDSKQREESIEGQLKYCTEFAEKNGYTIVGEYIDRAFSAKTDDRPQFQRMIHDSSKRNFQGVIVYQLDRFARNVCDATSYKKLLSKNGVRLISAKEYIPDTSDGILTETILMGLAAYYSVELSEKVNRGMDINATKCLSNGGTTPLGYKIVDHRYVIDEKTAPIVQEIFDKYAKGWTVKEICDSLNERDIKTARKSSFNKSSLNLLLKNRKYLGIYIFKDIEIPGGMPQIIDEDLFNRVAERIEANKHAPARSRAKEEYLLSGKLFCGYCRGKMIGHSSNQITRKGVRINYYRCANREKSKSCNKKLVRKQYIEDIIVNECRNLLTPKNIRRIANEVMKVVNTMSPDTELKQLKKLLGDAKTEKENQMVSLRACKDDLIRELIFEDLSKIAAEIKELERKYAIEKAKHYIVTEEQVIAHLNRFARGDVNDITYRRSLIKMFVNKIFLYDDKFTITFNTGDEEVTITDQMLDMLENELLGDSLCLSTSVVHQKNRYP